MAAAQRIVAVELIVAEEGSTAADFVPAGSAADPVDFTGDLLDFLLAGFTPANFTLMDFTASGSIIMASAAACWWPLLLVGYGWVPDWAGLITLIRTKAITAKARIPSTGIAKTLRVITPT